MKGSKRQAMGSKGQANGKQKAIGQSKRIDAYSEVYFEGHVPCQSMKPGDKRDQPISAKRITAYDLR